MATSLAKPPVDLRAALTQVEVESGQPETLPTAEARIGVSLPMLEKFVEDWELAILPYRPVHIEVDPAHDGNWETIFKGYLLPEGVSSDGYNTESLDLIARDPKIRLREPAALVDDLFGPLDLMQEDDGEDIFGAQCVQKLLGLQERAWATTFNGTGNAFTYFEPDHYPLKSGAGNSYFLATQTPETGGFHLPPPFGEDLERWIDRIAAYDRATWFYDPREGESGAWVYGDVSRFFAIRGLVVHELHDTTGGLVGDSLEDWPLLSRYAGEGVLESAFTQVQVWGATPEGTYASFKPAVIVGKAGSPDDVLAIDPLSENQSWRRTLLMRQDFIGRTAGQEFADALAWDIWSEFGGRAPQKWAFTLEDQILTARWGELVHFGPFELRVVRVKHTFSFGGSSSGRTTEITARSLSARGL